jgi:hypothetical protein
MMDTLKVIDSFSAQAGIRPFVLIGSFLHVQQWAHSRSSAVVFMGWNGLIRNHQQFHPAAFFMGMNGPGPSAVSSIGNIGLICIHWQCFSIWEVMGPFKVMGSFSDGQNGSIRAHRQFDYFQQT